MDKRSILWRGITTPKPNGEEFNNVWVKGDLIRSANRYYIHPVANAVKVQNELGRLIVMHEVDPSTLGECTGLRDKNGKLIFEGDILRHNSGTLHEVVFEQRNDKAYFGWVIDKVETWQFDWDFLRQLEVVGNIHDDPGLISKRRN